MTHKIKASVIIFLLIFLQIISGSLRAQSENEPFLPDGTWTSEFQLAGPNGSVYSILHDPQNGDLYIGGQFTLPAANIVKWNGIGWEALGGGVTGSAFNAVEDMVLDSKGNLYVAGSFLKAGTVSVENIARWDGQQWHSLGNSGHPGANNNIFALAIDSQDRLYVGGRFTEVGNSTINYVAMWDGEWHNLGNLNLDGSVTSLAIDSHDRLYIGGLFDHSSASFARGLIQWDGENWSELGTGLRRNVTNAYPYVNSLSIGPEDALYVGGVFDTAGGETNSNVALWKGGSWISLGGGLPDTYDINLVAADPDGGVYAEPHARMKIYRWDGTSWTDNGWTEKDYISEMKVLPDRTLLIGGRFTAIEQKPVPHLAQYRNGTWQAFGTQNTSVDGVINDIALIGGKVYAAGDFMNAGSVPSRGVAVWDGTSWSDVDGSLNGLATCIEPDGGGGFYIGGIFTTAGSMPAERIAHWTGTAWKAMGMGMNAPSVNDIAVGPDGDVYAVGSFTTAGGIPANRVARWDGAQWSPLGSGLNNYAYVYTLAFDPSGNLYVGGTFIGAGTVSAKYIAMWDGTGWTGLGGGLNAEVWDIIYSPVDNSMYASGQFSLVDGQPTAPVARWSITEQKWYSTQSADMALTNHFRLTLDSQNRILTVAEREILPGVRNPDLAWFDGVAWHWNETSIGSGQVRTEVLFHTSNDFFIGGSFIQVDNVVSPNIAHRVVDTAQAADFSLDGNEDEPVSLSAQVFLDNYQSEKTLMEVQFPALSSEGTLLLNGLPVTVEQRIPAALLDQLVFVPSQNFFGTTNVRWKGYSETGNETNIATLTFMISPVDDLLRPTDDRFITEEDTTLLCPVLENDVDVDGNTIVVEKVTQPEYGTAAIDDNGNIIYTPEPNFWGPVEFFYTIKDSNGETSDLGAKVSILVKPVNDAPVAVEDSADSIGPDPITIAVTNNDFDVDGDSITVTALTQPQHGTAVITDAGLVQYTPDADYAGIDEFSYRISDAQGGIAQAKIAVQHTPRYWIYYPFMTR